MYLSFYGLKIKPFQNSTNPEFFWLGDKQKETLAIFKYGLSKLPGILLLTGDAGTGKTTLVNVFLNSLGDQFIVVKIPDPDLEDIDFRKYLADALDFKTKLSDQDNFLANFSNFLETASTLGKKVILVIDECQRLSTKLLEEIIKLANLEKEEIKLLKILLIGQNEFEIFLKKNTSRVLHQLIAINYAITPLDLHETGDFIKYRLKIAGANRDIFSPEAITKIYEISSGIPCKINIICDLALLYGFGQKAKTVNGELIWECTENLRPQNFVSTQANNFSQFAAGGDSKTFRKNSPESQLNNVKPWRKKTFGMSILLMLTVFLIIYFNDLSNFFKFPHKVETQVRTQTSNSTTHKAPTDNTDTGKITTLSTTPVSKEEPKNDVLVNKPAGKNILPAAEQPQSDIAVEKVLINVDRSNPTDDLPATAPKDAGHVTENSSSAPLIAPRSVDQQIIPQDQAIKKDSNPIDPAETVQPTIKANQEETPTIEKVLKLEKEVPHPDIPPAKREISEAPEPSDVPVIQDNKTEVKELVGEKIEAKGKESPAPNAKKDTQDALPDNARNSSKVEETRHEVKEPPDNIDPGAIIDWVLKNRAK